MQFITITQATLQTTAALLPKRVLELETIIGDEILQLNTGICSVEIKQVKLFKTVEEKTKSIQGSILTIESTDLILTTRKIMDLQKRLRKNTSLEKVKVLLKK
jgi:chaperonin cofactor prefoldin